MDPNLISSDSILAASGVVATATWILSKILRALKITKAQRVQHVLEILESAALEIYQTQIRPKKLKYPGTKLSETDAAHYAATVTQTAKTRCMHAGIDFDAAIPPHKQRLMVERAVRSLKAQSNGRRVNPKSS